MTSADIFSMQPKQALFELTMQNSESSNQTFDDVMVEGLKRNVPPEVLTRLSELWEKTQIVAGEVVAIGKIVVMKILEFLIQNPGITIGIALGAIVAVMMEGIPGIGTIIAPLGAVIAMLYGAGVGAAIDEGDDPSNLILVARALAKKFLELFIAVLNGVKEYWVQKG